MHQAASVRCAEDRSQQLMKGGGGVNVADHDHLFSRKPCRRQPGVQRRQGELVYGFVPRFRARQGSVVVLSASVWLTLHASDLAVNRLQAVALGETTPAEALGQLLVRYGARLMEASVGEMQADGLQPDPAEVVWKLTEDDLEDLYLLLPLAGGKSCAYQQPIGRDPMCTAAAPSDQTATQT
jgi:hypothetical protein